MQTGFAQQQMQSYAPMQGAGVQSQQPMQSGVNPTPTAQYGQHTCGLPQQQTQPFTQANPGVSQSSTGGGFPTATAAPPQNYVNPSYQQGTTSTPNQDAATPKNGTTTPKDGTSTPKDGTSTPKDGTTTPKDGTTTQEEGSTAPEEGTITPKSTDSKPKDDHTGWGLNFSIFASNKNLDEMEEATTKPASEENKKATPETTEQDKEKAPATTDSTPADTQQKMVTPLDAFTPHTSAQPMTGSQATPQPDHTAETTVTGQSNSHPAMLVSKEVLSTIESRSREIAEQLSNQAYHLNKEADAVNSVLHQQSSTPTDQSLTNDSGSKQREEFDQMTQRVMADVERRTGTKTS